LGMRERKELRYLGTANLVEFRVWFIAVLPETWVNRDD
jgi:hypothetical protein